MLKISVEYKQLSRKINQFAVATGRTREDISRQVLKNMVTSATKFSPPGSAEATGKAAQRKGEGAIQRDLKKMGFQPVDIKHKENPIFAEPDAFHHKRLQQAQGGIVSRGGKQAFYVSKSKFTAMVKRLFEEVGKLSSGWTLAAAELGVPLPSWVSRHAGEGRGDVKLSRQQNITTMTAVNHVPGKASAVYAEMLRRKAYWVSYARGSLDRQLKAKLAGKWGK